MCAFVYFNIYVYLHIPMCLKVYVRVLVCISKHILIYLKYILLDNIFFPWTICECKCYFS